MADVYISRVDDLEAAIWKLFLAKNRLRAKDGLSLFVRLIVKVGWLDVAFSGSFAEIDELFMNVLRERHLNQYADLSIVEKYFGYGLKPVLKSEIRKLKEAILAKKLEESLNGPEEA